MYFGKIDRYGRLHFPKKVRKRLKLDNAFVEMEVESRKDKKREVLVLVPASSGNQDPVEAISSMNLPLKKKGWREIEKELEED